MWGRVRWRAWLGIRPQSKPDIKSASAANTLFQIIGTPDKVAARTSAKHESNQSN
jgi:hypothetical protein